MPSKRCSKCGAFKPLMGGVCAECRALESYELNKKARELAEQLTDDGEDYSDSTAADDINQALIAQYEKKKKAREHVPTVEEAYKEISERIISLNGIPALLAKKYRAQLNFLMKRYMFSLLGGRFGITDKETYSKNHIGEVIEVRGRWVIYRITSEKPDGMTIELNEEVRELIDKIQAELNKLLDEGEADDNE